MTEPDKAMRLSSQAPELSDDLSFESLKDGLKENLEFIKSSKKVNSEIKFGPTVISKITYIKTLEKLVETVSNKVEFNYFIKKNFDFYEVYGNEDWSRIKATSYYSPLLQASLVKTKTLSQPLYKTPDDMVIIDIDAFAEELPKWRSFKNQVLEQTSSKAIARARLVTDSNGPTKIVPYFKRSDIDENSAIKKAKNIIAYVDPIKSFFLQIQGSGVLEFADGKRMTVGYASQNGHPYVALGSKLLDKIPKAKMSMQSIESYLRTLKPEALQKVLNQNPSYVFFQEMKTKPQAYLGTEVIDGRTVATDQSLFPKGTLAFLKFEKPVFENEMSTEPKSWMHSSRFVFDQDTGGAIRGPGRLDIYAGSGIEAEQFAGVMKNPAQLYYLVPKPKFIKEIESLTQ